MLEYKQLINITDNDTRTRMLLCMRCKYYTRSTTYGELKFDCITYGPRSFTYFCRDCRVKWVTDCYFYRCFHPGYYCANLTTFRCQRERNHCIINKNHYWGVTSFEEGKQIGEKLYTQGSEYWWEFVSRRPLHNGVLVLVITNLRCADPDDNVNTYIVKYEAGGPYHVRYNSCEFENAVCDYFCAHRALCTDSFHNLSTALSFVRVGHENRVHDGGQCDCQKINRYTEVRNSKVIHQPWSLLSMSSFMIKSYAFYHKQMLYHTNKIPQPLKYCIAGVDAFKQFRTDET
jgi:hypothetical protein